MDTLGFVCEPDHGTFWPVAERLSARGFDVEFLRPADPISRADIDGLAALVNGRLHPEAFDALRYADRTGVPTWNGFAATTALSARLVALEALEAVGCRVPAVRFEMGAEGPDEEYVRARRYAWGEDPATVGPLYVEAVADDPVEHRYYAVDDGRETHVRALRIRSSLSGTEPVVEQTDVDVATATRVRELLDGFDARAVGVDFAHHDGETYALRATPAPTFAGAGMRRQVADSVASLATLGA
ncbi:hypothetical protein [Haloarcula marina]|uniref:hypothetical protein n=1 Tax=Haloarcula marina TaxID=2961574 RepID=UPI0020B8C142|nr:hypothetical protein [Halomicroarcula marina]